jgi:hypothetical protein
MFQLTTRKTATCVAVALLIFWLNANACHAKQEVMEASFFEVVRKIENAQHAKTEFVENLTGRTLTSHGYWHSTSDQDERALVPQVEMTNDNHGTTQSVLLSVNHNLHLSANDVKLSFGAHPKERPHPEPALKNVTFSYEYEQRSHWISFWFEGRGVKAEARFVEVTYR